jgi:hypothetical protein
MVRCLTTLVVLLAAAPAVRAQGTPTQPARLSGEGRFLYANDDDWDWASPLGAAKPSRLSEYGKMEWSALDWMEEGLDEVRGVLIGTPPLIGDYLSMDDLNKLRTFGKVKRSYKQLKHEPNVIRDLLKQKDPPNLIIMMQDNGYAGRPPVTAEDVAAALEFVRRGGRLILLDDWEFYGDYVGPFLVATNFQRMKPKPEAVDADLKAKVLEHVKLLDSAQFKVREQAAADLLKLGKPIVPILRQHEPESEEQRSRIEQILKKLEPKPLAAPATSTNVGDMFNRAKAIHAQCELRRIIRNGNHEAGDALCIIVPEPKK